MRQYLSIANAESVSYSYGNNEITEIQGTVNITVHCSPASGWTCYLYNCDGSYTGKSCGPTISTGKCGVASVSEGCYYFVIDNGGTTCTGQQFQYSGAFPFYHDFYCTDCVNYFN